MNERGIAPISKIDPAKLDKNNYADSLAAEAERVGIFTEADTARIRGALLGVIGAVIGGFVLLLVNPLSALWFGIFILILQQVDGNVIGPLILGDHVGLSAFWIMLSITVGGGLFGFAGMLLSVPAFALVYAIARTAITKRLQERGLPSDTEHYIKAPETLHEEKAHEASDT